MSLSETAEYKRLEEAKSHTKHWRRWGPYLSDRQWGTVREDYSDYGMAWDHFPHEQARSRAYRWGEDGLMGISDNHQRLCFGLALWNEKDPILKERLFGLTGSEGNHGEDVKEYYFYIDSTPTHSYMKALYKYPQTAFPYERLVQENRIRGRLAPEFELMQTGAFDENRYFDVFMEYAKDDVDDILIRITATNRGPDAAPLHLLPTLWFRNTWSWGRNQHKPLLRQADVDGVVRVMAEHPTLGTYSLAAEGAQQLLFTENETNNEKLFSAPNASPYVKDGINDYIVSGRSEGVNPKQEGTKVSAHYQRTLQPGETWVVRLRLRSRSSVVVKGGDAEFDAHFKNHQAEADAFYNAIAPQSLGEDARNVQRQAFAGMLWSKQYYRFIVKDWLEGDPASPPPSNARRRGRNRAWEHMYAEDILSMPDKWEYPWFASWDLAFHCIPLVMIDPDFAKHQLELLTREWYMHPNGQIPAYEWAFGDVNPPVHAWAAWRVYKIDEKATGKGDRLFLERVFQKLLLNFTWWVNRKDVEGNNIFQGGFLGLDNIGVFDRNMPLLGGTRIEQSDGTSWMAMYSLNLLKIALELAEHNKAYEDIASKFFEHFLFITEAMKNKSGMTDESLWDDEDGFFYDSLHSTSGGHMRLKVRSAVGLIPLFAVETLEVDSLFKLPGFARRMNWFMKNRPDLTKDVTCNGAGGACERRLLSIVTPEMLRRILDKMLDENEFLGPYGVRAVSKVHKDHPYVLALDGQQHSIAYEPAESSSGLFGGNSNWRGPVWMPINFLLIESLQKFHHYLGDDFKVACPTGSGQMKTLWEVAAELSHRLMGTFLQDSSGRRPIFGGEEKFQTDENWNAYPLFYEYIHGDNGAGIGASHQTGWTGVIAKLVQQCGEHCQHPTRKSASSTVKTLS
jgi:hypothetical protein